MGSKGTLNSGKAGERLSLLQFTAAVGCESAGVFSTCFLVTWVLAALQSPSSSDCCPHLSLALCLTDKTARKKPSSCVLSAVAWPRSGLRREIHLALTGAICGVHYLLWVTHPNCQREKDLLYFLPAPGSCCCCETAKTKHPLNLFLF